MTEPEQHTVWQKMRRPLLFAIFIFTALLIGRFARQDTPEMVRFSGPTMGTAYNVSYFDEEERDFQEQVDSLLKVVNLSMSTYIDTSIISILNRSNDTLGGVPVDEHFKTVFKKASAVYRGTSGSFDPTVMPLVNAWGFGFRNAESVDSLMIDSLLQLIGFEAFELRGDRVFKSEPHAMLDFSAIAKGYAVDAIGLLLERHGIASYLVDIGGEVRCRGKKQHDEWWKIGIDKPVDQKELSETRTLQVVVTLQDMSMATSGNYRNFYLKDGKKYAHTINPFTGYPELNELLSVTIFANDCMTADAYATACMVMGLEEAWKLVNQTPELEAYFIYRGKNNTFETRLTDKVRKWIIEQEEI